MQGVLARVRVLFTGGEKLVWEKLMQLCRHLLGIRVGVADSLLTSFVVQVI